jgi:hypothetical protein
MTKKKRALPLVLHMIFFYFKLRPKCGKKMEHYYDTIVSDIFSQRHDNTYKSDIQTTKSK